MARGDQSGLVDFRNIRMRRREDDADLAQTFLQPVILLHTTIDFAKSRLPSFESLDLAFSSSSSDPALA